MRVRKLESVSCVLCSDNCMHRVRTVFTVTVYYVATQWMMVVVVVRQSNSFVFVLYVLCNFYCTALLCYLVL